MLLKRTIRAGDFESPFSVTYLQIEEKIAYLKAVNTTPEENRNTTADL